MTRRLAIVAVAALALVVAPVLSGCAPASFTSKVDALVGWLHGQQLVTRVTNSEKSGADRVITATVATHASDAQLTALATGIDQHTDGDVSWHEVVIDLDVGSSSLEVPSAGSPASRLAAFLWLRNDHRVTTASVDRYRVLGITSADDVAATSRDFHAAMVKNVQKSATADYTTTVSNASGHLKIESDLGEAYPDAAVGALEAMRAAVPGTGAVIDQEAAAPVAIQVYADAPVTLPAALAAAHHYFDAFGADRVGLHWQHVVDPLSAFTDDRLPFAEAANAIPDVTLVKLASADDGTTSPLVDSTTIAGWTAAQNLVTTLLPGTVGIISVTTKDPPTLDSAALPASDPRRELGPTLLGLPGILSIEFDEDTMSITFAAHPTTAIMTAAAKAIVDAGLGHTTVTVECDLLDGDTPVIVLVTDGVAQSQNDPDDVKRYGDTFAKIWTSLN